MAGCEESVLIGHGTSPRASKGGEAQTGEPVTHREKVREVRDPGPAHAGRSGLWAPQEPPASDGVIQPQGVVGGNDDGGQKLLALSPSGFLLLALRQVGGPFVGARWSLSAVLT